MPDYSNIKGIFIGESEPSLPTGWQGYAVWIKPSTGKLFGWNGSAWTETGITFDNIEVKHIEVTEQLEVPGGDGIDSEVVVGTKTLKFSKGVLYEVEEE